MTVWIAIAVGGAASFGLRWLPARWLSDRPLPPVVERGLATVGPAAFTALAAPAVAISSSDTAAPPVARLAAVAVAGPVAWRTRSTVATLLTGLPVLWLTSLVVGA